MPFWTIAVSADCSADENSSFASAALESEMTMATTAAATPRHA
jgi:hypothetical protein